MPNHLNACRHMQAHAHLSRYVQTQSADTWIALPTHAEYMKHERAYMIGKWELQYEEKSVALMLHMTIMLPCRQSMYLLCKYVAKARTYSSPRMEVLHLKNLKSFEDLQRVHNP